MRIDWQLTILHAAAWLVPADRRSDWLAEWRSELWYVRRAGSPAARFCLGALPDALSLLRQSFRTAPRLESPVQCLLVLAILASTSLCLALRWPVRRSVLFPSADSRLVMIAPHRRAAKPSPAISVAQYETWANHLPRQFTALAFSDRSPAVNDARALIEHPGKPQLPPETLGFVIARMRDRPEDFGHISLPGANGAFLGYDYHALAPGMRNPLSALAIMSVIAWLVMRATPLSSPLTRGLKVWAFLAAKLLLILPIVAFGALDLAYLIRTPIEGHLMLFGWMLAIRWVFRDQQQRCPVCLRLLINPVGIGQASQTFLGWYGTELMCAKGHGMLHLPEIPSSSSSISRWVQLDPSWNGLF